MGDIMVYTDNQPHQKTWNRISTEHLALGENCDLWEDIAAELLRKRIVLKTKWARAHIRKDTDIDLDLDIWIYSGNAAADVLADAGALRHQIPDKIAEGYKENEERAKLVLHRLLSRVERTLAQPNLREMQVAALTSEQKEQRRQEAHGARNSMVGQVWQDTQNGLVECGRSVLCKMCFARSPPSLRHGLMVKWLKT